MTAEGKTFTVQMEVRTASMEDVAIYRTTSDSFATWTKMDAIIEGNIATFQAEEGGVYVGRSHTNVGLIVGITVGTLLLVGVIVGATMFYHKRNPQAFSGVARSFTAKV